MVNFSVIFILVISVVSVLNCTDTWNCATCIRKGCSYIRNKEGLKCVSKVTPQLRVRFLYTLAQCNELTPSVPSSELASDFDIHKNTTPNKTLATFISAPNAPITRVEKSKDMTPAPKVAIQNPVMTSIQTNNALVPTHRPNMQSTMKKDTAPLENASTQRPATTYIPNQTSTKAPAPVKIPSNQLPTQIMTVKVSNPPQTIKQNPSTAMNQSPPIPTDSNFDNITRVHESIMKVKTAAPETFQADPTQSILPQDQVPNAAAKQEPVPIHLNPSIIPIETKMECPLSRAETDKKPVKWVDGLEIRNGEVFYNDESLQSYTSPKTSSCLMFRLIKNYCYNYVLTSTYLKSMNYTESLGIKSRYGGILIQNPLKVHAELCEKITRRKRMD